MKRTENRNTTTGNALVMKSPSLRNFLVWMVRFERTAPAFQVRYSNQTELHPDNKSKL